MACVAICLASTSVHAMPVVLNETRNQTVAGEEFTFTFLNAPAPTGSDGTFTIHLRTDLGTAFNETADWNIEGVVSGPTIGPFDGPFLPGAPLQPGGPFDVFIEHVPIEDYEIVDSFVVSAADLNTIAADNQIVITVDLGDGVPFSNPNAGQFFAEVTLEYTAIPEPMCVSLMALSVGLLTLSVRQRG